MMFWLLKWLRRNVSMLLLFAAMFCVALALGDLVRGATWSLFLPVTLAAVGIGWGLGRSRLTLKQAWASLSGLGIPAVFIYVGGLARPLGRLILSVFPLIFQSVIWIWERSPVDAAPLLAAWAALTGQVGGLFARLWGWISALLAGSPFVDPLSAGLFWCLLLWLAGSWAGWQMRREKQALQALAPGGTLLAVVLDYTRADVGLLVIYLGLLLALIGMARDEWRHVQWGRRKVDYSESIRIDTLVMVSMLTVALTLSAAGTPSISWRKLVEKLRRPDSAAEEQVARSLGLEVQTNVATTAPYLSGGLPRRHLLDTPPEQLRQVVFTVSTGDFPSLPEAVVEIHPPHYYWRAITYDVYSGVGWSSSTALDAPLSANTSLLTLPPDFRAVTQHVKRSPGEENTYVYWTGTLAQADTDIEIAWRTRPPEEPAPARNGDMLGALADPDEYTVVSYLPQFDAAQLRDTGSDYPAQIVNRYLKLPESTPERVLALAREITQAAPTPYDRAVAIETYLRSYPYTLDVKPPPPGSDVVDYFLFDAQQGYCDYYASAMVVLARAVGLPARLVIGYASGDYDMPRAEYIVRQEDAHSWPEIYFAGIGWIEFEPTAGQPALDRDGEESASVLPPSLPTVKPAFTWLKTSWRALLSSLGGQFLIALIVIILLFALWQLGEMGLLYVLPAHRSVARMYSRMEKVSVRLLPNLPDGHTPRQFGSARMRKLGSVKNKMLRQWLSPVAIEIEELVMLYETQVFSEHAPVRSQVRDCVRAWMRLRWRLWLANGWNRYFVGVKSTPPHKGRGRQ